jgi:asparagine synthase (glutamine-hydrolysing)
MCGIAGYFHAGGLRADKSVLQTMTRALTHRGPDEEGYHLDGLVGLGHRRLSIIDLSSGQQPMHNADKSVTVIFNGEIFNYVELREELKKKGHRFATHSDTEVIVHGYVEWGVKVLDHLNGQFAIAVWDAPNRKLLLARDRVGIRPLFYARAPDGALLFASEAKSLLRYPGMRAEIDPIGVSQTFTFWVNVPPRTVFKDVQELAAGHYLVATPEGTRTAAYWKHRFPDAKDYDDKPIEHYAERLREILFDSTTLQLRADVPVAAYLSGGLDSSIITALVKQNHNPGLITFSVAFADKAFDERAYQQQMVDFLKTDHRIIEVDYGDIGEAFSDVMYYSEKPMIRTAPAPLLRLSGLVRKNGVKVVLTGEGSDEIFGGYNIFREDKVRRFWAQSPDSKWRPQLISSLYHYVNKNPAAQGFWRMFFKKGLTDTSNPYYSHLIRWSNTAQIKSMFTPEFRERMGREEDLMPELDAFIDKDMMRWHPLCRAQYLEMALFMSGYLLCSQGDRMMMGNSVEGRFPFLDHRVVEFAATIPPKYKIRILNEKYILKKAYEKLLPASIVNRPKTPYRAPISRCFMDEKANLASSLLAPAKIKEYGYFSADQAEKLMAKARKNADGQISERDDMAMVTMASTQLLHHHFLRGNLEVTPGAAGAKAGATAA